METNTNNSFPTRVARSRIGHLRLAYRWLRFAAQSARHGDWDFVVNALRAEFALAKLLLTDRFSPAIVSCNICTWNGSKFYPNTGPGYDERDILCPGCNGLDRHRALVALLALRSDFFRASNRVIEVAPMRGFEAMCLAQNNLNYTSFDQSRHAMERGDITQMHFATGEADYFICFHVLEHIPNEAGALREMHRVLKPKGCLVIQVPIDWSLVTTIEYDAPNPREVGHVRRYGSDFCTRIAKAGFEVEALSARDAICPDDFAKYGLSDEPIFFARKRVS